MADKKYCWCCNGSNPPDAKFCAACGVALVSAATPPPDTAPSGSPSTWKPPSTSPPKSQHIEYYKGALLVLALVAVALMAVALSPPPPQESPATVAAQHALLEKTVTIRQAMYANESKIPGYTANTNVVWKNDSSVTILHAQVNDTTKQAAKELQVAPLSLVIFS